MKAKQEIVRVDPSLPDNHFWKRAQHFFEQHEFKLEIRSGPQLAPQIVFKIFAIEVRNGKRSLRFLRNVIFAPDESFLKLLIRLINNEMD